MPFDPAIAIPRDGFAIAGERHRLDRKRGLFTDFAHHRLHQRFANLDTAARQRVEARRRRPGATHDQHLAVADDGGADREDWCCRVGSPVRHGSALEPASASKSSPY